jgi:outer membrane protein assembly factor BamE (lipoprotein component of BamABCDE complex)
MRSVIPRAACSLLLVEYSREQCASAESLPGSDWNASARHIYRELQRTLCPTHVANPRESGFEDAGADRLRRTDRKLRRGASNGHDWLLDVLDMGKGDFMSRFLLCAIATMSLCLGAVACARSIVGSPIHSEFLYEVKSGKTTKAEVLRLFGSPYQIETVEDREILTYVYGKDTVMWYVFYTQRNQKADVLTFFIDHAGVVSNYSFSKDVAIPDFYKQPRVNL